MIHDGFIYLATLMLLAAILVNLPVYLRGKGAQTFFKFAPPIVLINYWARKAGKHLQHCAEAG